VVSGSSGLEADEMPIRRGRRRLACLGRISPSAASLLGEEKPLLRQAHDGSVASRAHVRTRDRKIALI
jgi:hypothetical protein